MTQTANTPGWARGMDNIHAAVELGRDTLRQATNVDVLDSGKVRTRVGRTLLSGLVAPHSLWGRHGLGFVVDGSTLYSLDRTGAVAAVVTGLPAQQRTAFVEVNGDVYYSSMAYNGMIRGGVRYGWTIETPVNLPAPAQIGGALPQGTYTVSMTYVDILGREGTASLQVQFTGVGGMTLIGLPVPVSNQIVAKRIYITDVDGEIQQRAIELPANAAFADVTALAFGPVLKTEGKGDIAFGDSLAYYNGQVFIGSGVYVFFTDDLTYHLMNQNQSWYIFPAPVTAVIGMRDGIYVCADRIYFLSDAGTEKATQKKVFDFGAYHGSVAAVPNSTDSIVMTARGALQLSDGGVVHLLGEGRYIPGTPSQTAAIIREHNGVRQYVCSASNVAPNNLAIGASA